MADRLIEFNEIPLTIVDRNIDSVFFNKNNKTLGETLIHKKYSKFRPYFIQVHEKSLPLKIGDFLKMLKESNDSNYEFFLNKNGDTTYCKFHITDNLKDKGLYCFSVDDDIKYVGRCTDTFKKRINYGYGTIHPKNCFIDGQSTNCHINSLINTNINASSEIKLGVYTMNNRTTQEIELLELQILATRSFEWNVQTKSKLI